MSGKIFTETGSSRKIAARLALTAVLSAVAGFVTALRHRLAVREIASFDDRMLRDIGITRADVDHALGQPLHRDPSLILMIRRLDNRRRSKDPLTAAHPDEGASGDDIPQQDLRRVSVQE